MGFEDIMYPRGGSSADGDDLPDEPVSGAQSGQFIGTVAADAVEGELVAVTLGAQDDTYDVDAKWQSNGSAMPVDGDDALVSFDDAGDAWLVAWGTMTASAGAGDHGALTGLADDDHAQYHTDARGDARYWQLTTDLATQVELDAHVSDAGGAHAASAISFTPAAGIAATDVQAAIVEDAGDLAAHIADATAAHAASAISIVDAAGDFTATDVEGALAELQAYAEADATALSNHLADAADAHDASAISVLDAGGRFTATDVEAVLAEIDTALDAHVADAAGAHAASAISIVDAAGDFTATDVEGALAELQADAEADATALANHLADAADAHDASAISVVSTTLVGTGTDAQAVFEELDNAIVATEAVANAAAAAAMFVGQVVDWPGPSRSIPSGWLACFGQSISRTTYADLYAALCPIITSGGTATAANDRVTATAHGLVVGDAVFIDSLTGGTGITADTMYYVATVVDANNITLGTGRTVVAATGVATVTGAPLNITADGTNVVLRHAPHGVASSTNFNVPDYREVGSIGLPTMGGSERTTHGFTWSNVLGLQAGEATHLLTSGESGLPAHTHPPAASATNFYTNGTPAGTTVAVPGALGVRGDTATGSNATANAASAHNTVAPAVLVNKIIYAGV